MSNVEFKGPGPFDLPAAQAARADKQGDRVLLSFRCLVAPNRLELVRISVENSQALDLANRISRSATGGESK